MGLRVENVQHRYGDRLALHDISFEAEDGEILCLLGRSGCGKSTLLNLVAGMMPLQAGQMFLGADVLASHTFNPPPEKRPVGLVFQEGALFPHLTVAQNVGFGVADKAARAETVTRLLEQIGLAHMADRYPHTLSGGEQQRVAVARALAPGPAVMLMDEPFASIDITLRRRLREDMRALMKARGGITLLVTHDPEEAIEIADRIAVLESGRITQIGTAKDLHDRPASLFVGLMADNGTVIEGRVKAGLIATPFGDVGLNRVQFNDPAAVQRLQEGDPVDLLIYPFQARITPAEEGGQIADIRSTGRCQIVRLDGQAGASALFEIAPDMIGTVGQTVQLQPVDRPWLVFPR